MGLLEVARRVLSVALPAEPEPAAPAPSAGNSGGGFNTLSDVAAASDLAASQWSSYPTAFACVSRIAATLAAMPRFVAEDVGNGVCRRVAHPLNNVLARPNRIWDARQTFELAFLRMVATGNGYLAIERRAAGAAVSGLIPCWDALGGWRRARDAGGGYLDWSVQMPVGIGIVRSASVPDSEVCRMHGPGFDGLRAPSPMRVAARAMKMGRGSQDHINKRFDDQFGTVIVEADVDKQIATGITTEQMQTWADEINSELQDAQRENKSLVMKPGFKIHDRSIISPSDLQLLDVMGFSVEDICRIFSVPPRMLGHMSSGVRVEMKVGSQAEDYYRFAIRPWQRRVEEQFTCKLLAMSDQTRGLRVVLDDADVRHGSLAEQVDMAAKAYSGSGLMTLNEARRLVGLAPVDGGDEFAKSVIGAGREEGGRPDGAENEAEPE